MAEVYAVGAHVTDLAGSSQRTLLSPAQVSLRNVHQTGDPQMTRQADGSPT